MPLEVDKAYAAGLIDGEGSISARRHNEVRNSFSICVRVDMCDREPLDWLADVFGGHVKRIKRTTKSGKPIYDWVLFCKKAATFLSMILPYLKIKKKRAELAIELAGTAKISHRYVVISKDETIHREKLVAAIRAHNFASNARIGGYSDAIGS